MGGGPKRGARSERQRLGVAGARTLRGMGPPPNTEELPKLKYLKTVVMSKWRMIAPSYTRSLAARKLQRRWRKTRGPGRGYRPGMSRFGRLSQPELKSKVLAGRGAIGANTTLDAVVFPSITQGITETQRLGNRVNGKFLNIKLMLTQSRQPDISLPQDPAVVRWVLWKNKDPTSNAAGAFTNLNLTSFINTKTTKIVKTGYITLGNAGVSKVKSINTNLRNGVIDFKEDSDVSANTTQRYYLAVYSSQSIDYEFQSKLYFADP